MKKFIYSVLLVFSVVGASFIFTSCNKGGGSTQSTIEVRVASRRTGYEAFDKFDDEGLILRASYSNGTIVDIKEGWTISYVSVENDTETYHSDCFYGGETKVRIEYDNMTCYLSVDPIEKINQNLVVSFDEYSQIYTGSKIEIPATNVSAKNNQGEDINDIDAEIVYCKSFESFNNYQLTDESDGASNNGGAPSKVGSYKAFVKIKGNNNYKTKYSSVVDFNIVDESSIKLCAEENEEFFAWRENSIIAKIDPAYIQFELKTENNVKVLKYYSSFADDGYAMIFDDHITLVSEFGKTNISYENDEILLGDVENPLTKWNKPAYLGVYEMTITPELAQEHKITLNEDKVCRLTIYVDETLSDGKVYFTLDFLWIHTDEICMDASYNGVATYSVSQSGEGTLAFNRLYGGIIENLFIMKNVSTTEFLTSIIVAMPGSERLISNGEYKNILAE